MEFRKTYSQNLSGGNKRKLNTALAMLGAPRIFVLDEPTAGLDPVSKRYFWKSMRFCKENFSGAFLLTTHTANEAEALSDKIGIIVNGQLVRINTLLNLNSEDFIVTILTESRSEFGLSGKEVLTRK